MPTPTTTTRRSPATSAKETRPSPSALDAIAHALHLDDAEHRHLSELSTRATRYAPEAPPPPSRSVRPDLKLVLETPRPSPFDTAEEVAAAAAFLLGREAGFITGADLLMDGGVTAALRAGELTTPYRADSRGRQSARIRSPEPGGRLSADVQCRGRHEPRGRMARGNGPGGRVFGRPPHAAENSGGRHPAPHRLRIQR
ncbi:SDR family oxidoreductase [Streptomyces sp. NBC_00019]|uniref:SDR family oxidoreductase n=1 Tax=Streptomyces sp. NBC_00019 TaxID=2975623 RepID=UPI00386A58CF